MGGSAERSVKGRIERALVALLARKPLLEITVSDLVRETPEEMCDYLLPILSSF